VVEPLERRASSVKDGIAELAGSVKGELADDWHAAKEGAQGAAENVQEVAKDARNALEGAGRAVLRTFKENPVPIGLATVGLAWLVMNIRGRSSPASSGSRVDSGGREDGAGSAIASAVTQVKRTAKNATQQVQRTAGEIAGEAEELTSTAKSRLVQATERVGRSTRTVVHEVSERGKRLERSVEDTLRGNPAVVGATAAAIGAVTAMVLPRTRIEDEWLGASRDQVIEKAQDAARGAVEKVESAAKKVVGVVRETQEILHH